MIRCDECRYWQISKYQEHRGVCKINLPPWVFVDKPHATYGDEGCDLGQAALAEVKR